MVQPNTANKRKPKPKPGNNAAGPGSQLPPMMPQVNQVMAVVVPVEIFEQMKRQVRAQPFEDVELLMQAMKNLAPQQVNITAPGQG